LGDGDYVLQWKALVANWTLPLYSCSLLRIAGGDTTQVCDRPENPRPKCRRDAGPFVDTLIRDSRMGRFCFDITAPTEIVNSDCDPRVSCG
jgi:hypothetical protein